MEYEEREDKLHHILDNVSERRNEPGASEQAAIRIHNIVSLLELYPNITKQAYLWGRTDSMMFLNPNEETPSSVAHHEGLTTTVVNLEDLKISRAMESFRTNIRRDDNFSERRKLRREGRAYHNAAPGRPITIKSLDMGRFLRQQKEYPALAQIERDRLREELRAAPEAIHWLD